MKTPTFFLASLALILWACGPSRKSQMDALCSQYFPMDIPGAEVLVMIGDEVVYDQGFGGKEEERPIDGETFFNIASCSKQFTAVAVLQLAEQGLIDINAPIHRYFPELESSIWDSVLVWHLLAHTSGVPDERGYLSREQKIQGDEALATEYLQHLDHLHFRPGTAYEYINPTFVLAGMLVERVSGQPFTDYVREHIFLPAGMMETLYFDRNHQELIPRMVHGYEYADTSDMPEERTASSNAGAEAHDWYEYDFGEETFFATRPDGGIYTSAHELVRWEKALRAALNGSKESIVGAELLQEAMSPKTEVSGSTWSDYQNRPGTWYGYGWFVEPDKGCIYHTGDNGGFKILIARYPEKAALLLVLANRADWDRYELKTHIETIYHLANN